jgi:hypothetical protein
VSPNKKRRGIREKNENKSLKCQEEERVKSKGEKQEERKMRKCEDEAEFLEITSFNVSHFLSLFSPFSSTCDMNALFDSLLYSDGLRAGRPKGRHFLYSLVSRLCYGAHPVSRPIFTGISVPQDKSGRGVKLTTHILPLLR